MAAQFPSIDELCRLESEIAWSQWLAPDCCLLQRARELQGRLTEEQQASVRQLLDGSVIANLAVHYQNALRIEVKEPFDHWLPACCFPNSLSTQPTSHRYREQGAQNNLVHQSVMLLHGMIHGVLAAAAFRTWTESSEIGLHAAAESQSTTQSFEAFLTEALKCAQAYRQAWPLISEPWQLQTRASDPIDAALEKLQDRVLDIPADSLLAVRRLLKHVLGLPEREPLFSASATVLLYDALRAKGQEGVALPLTIAAHDEGATAVYLDPVAMGLTVIDDEMLKSLQIAWKRCQSDWHEHWGGTAPPLSLRVSPFVTLHARHPQPSEIGPTSRHTLPRSSPIALLAGGSAGVVIACGMSAVAKGERLNADATATAALADDDQGVLLPVDPDSVLPKLNAAKEAGLRVVLQGGQFAAFSEDIDRLRLQVFPASTVDEAFEHLTGDAQMERALKAYCRLRVEAWESARRDPDHPDKLIHYVDPHYSWLKDTAEELVDSSRQRASRDHFVYDDETDDDTAEKGTSRYEPVAQQEDDAEAELVRLFTGSRFVCVTEDAGAGKTVFTRRLEAFLCSERAQRRLFDGQPALVVRFERRARSWPNDFESGLIKSLADAVEPACLGGRHSHSPEAIAEWALKRGQVVLILDALDQVRNPECIDSLQAFLTAGKGQACRVVMTSRAFAVNERKSLFASAPWRFARIHGFDFDQQYQYLQGILPEVPATEANRWEKRYFSMLSVFPQYEEMRDLLSVPVVLALVRDQAERGRVRSFRTRGELYLQVEEDLMQRAAEKLAIKAQYRQRLHWRRILAATAFEMMRRECWDYTVTGATLLSVQDAVADHWIERRGYGEWSRDWEEIEQVTSFTYRCLLEDASHEQFGFKHRGMMEFYCGLHLAGNTQPDWVDEQPDEPLRCGDPLLSTVANDDNWYWAWRFAAELPCHDANPEGSRAVQNSRVLAASLGELFRLPKDGPRPTALMYFAWHRFEIDVRILEQFQWTDAHGQPLAGEALIERGRQLLLPGHELVMEEFRRPLRRLLEACDESQLSDVDCRRRRIAREMMDSFVCCPAEDAWPEDYEFWMGSPEGVGDQDEFPRHRVLMAPFKLMKTAVTREQFLLFEETYEEYLDQWTFKFAPNPRSPAVPVDWYDAFVFSKWLGDRYCLPTETQWEFACRAGRDGPTDHFHFGATISSSQVNFSPDSFREEGYLDPSEFYPNLVQLQFWGDPIVNSRYRDPGLTLGRGHTVDVDFQGFSPNAWGLHQMHGNVWEWCWDWYDPEWYAKRSHGRAPGAAIVADCGPPTGLMRVLRGGNFSAPATNCRSARRVSIEPKQIDWDPGFRVCYLID